MRNASNLKKSLFLQIYVGVNFPYDYYSGNPRVIRVNNNSLQLVINKADYSHNGLYVCQELGNDTDKIIRMQFKIIVTSEYRTTCWIIFPSNVCFLMLIYLPWKKLSRLLELFCMVLSRRFLLIKGKWSIIEPLNLVSSLHICLV